MVNGDWAATCGRSRSVEISFYHVGAESLPVNASAAKKSGGILPANLPVNKTQRTILALMLENNRTTYYELAEKLGKTKEMVRANLRIRRFAPFA